MPVNLASVTADPASEIRASRFCRRIYGSFLFMGVVDMTLLLSVLVHVFLVVDNSNSVWAVLGRQFSILINKLC